MVDFSQWAFPISLTIQASWSVSMEAPDFRGRKGQGNGGINEGARVLTFKKMQER